MKTSDFYFDLPDELIAQHPSGVRGEDKLFVLDRGVYRPWNAADASSADKTAGASQTDGTAQFAHHMMADLPDLIETGTLMIFNNSRVRRSRCYGRTTDTGREAEFLMLQCLPTFLPGAEPNSVWKAMVKNAKKQKTGKVFAFPDGTQGTILENPADAGTEFRTVHFDRSIDEPWFERNGHIPLPPYIKREDTEEDSERYQNVYAKEVGSAACPTAGLHFTEDMLGRLAAKNIDIAYVTLHVGLGTFLPVRAENIEDHKMHEEYFTVSEETAAKVNAAKKEGRTVLAVGTTSVRTLESAWQGGSVEEGGYLPAGGHSTSIFIYPGYKFKCVDRMFTNFHTPGSTLMMLVSAFAGKQNIMTAYQTAVKERYRFFSYGDAMLIR